MTVQIPPLLADSREPRAPCAIVLAIDRSTAAADLSSEELKAGLLECLAILRPGDRLALVTFSSCAHVLLPIGEPERDRVLAAIEALPPCSDVADPHFGWLAAIRELKRCADLDKRIVLILSPGGATVGSYRLAELALEYASAAEEGYCTRIVQPLSMSSLEATSHAFEVISMHGRGMTRRFEPAREALSKVIVSEVHTATLLNLKDVSLEIESSQGVIAQLHGVPQAAPGWRLRNLGPGDKLEGLELTFSAASAPLAVSSGASAEPAHDARLIAGVYFLDPAKGAASVAPALRTLFKVMIRGKRFDGQACVVGSAILELPLINHERFLAQATKAHRFAVERESCLSGEGRLTFPRRNDLRELTERACLLRANAGVLELAVIRFAILHDDLLYVLCRLSSDSEFARESGSHDLVMVSEGKSSNTLNHGVIHASCLGWEVVVNPEWVARARAALQEGIPKRDLIRQLRQWMLDAV
ncbi:MAG: hypothetical protein J0L85_20395 [Zoogloea sp.]|nr:hypothetical protein [Zoogloea sp.]MCA0188528.1 hypothetical protein [Pseudomonadota bacterium]